jgi:DNA-binding MarR family transcriptional regulator
MSESHGHYISSIYRHLQIYLNKQFSNTGFGSGQYLFFINIAQNEGINQKDLSDHLAIDKATTTKAVSKLTKLGYIVQKQNIQDKRFYNLYLTDKGRDILPEIKTILKGTRNILQKGMSSEECDQSLKLLGLLLNNILLEVKEKKELI